MSDTKAKTKSLSENSISQNIEDVLKLEKRERASISLSEKIANSVTAFTGSMIYVGVHII